MFSSNDAPFNVIILRILFSMLIFSTSEFFILMLGLLSKFNGVIVCL